MENMINNLYFVTYTSGIYEMYRDIDTVVIGKANAENIFKRFASGIPCDDDGEVVMYKAKISSDSCIVPDRNSELDHKVYNPVTGSWETEVNNSE